MSKGLLISGVFLSLAVSGCNVTKPSEKALSHLSTSYAVDEIGYCYGHGCHHKGQVSLNEGQWHEVQKLFKARDLSAAEERQAITVAIGYIERIAGQQNGTDKDKAGTFLGDVGDRQLDCIDEAVNASNFISLMERDGLLKYHALQEPQLRSWVSGNILHATAVLEQVSGKENNKTSMWSVDSSFFKNGENATVSPLDQWQTGWVPEGGVN
ncbi:hypothetical protein [Kiloniella majae]|uniref:hypothetical protein n=1 Tax=Kiloniella majae TaxID=1938558 RepID=UPI000A278327|nr:hypothetical protein [Kiloniella majae]